LVTRVIALVTRWVGGRGRLAVGASISIELGRFVAEHNPAVAVRIIPAVLYEIGIVALVIDVRIGVDIRGHVTRVNGGIAADRSGIDRGARQGWCPDERREERQCDETETFRAEHGNGLRRWLLSNANATALRLSVYLSVYRRRYRAISPICSDS
jgi:hypothetical protein